MDRLPPLSQRAKKALGLIRVVSFGVGSSEISCRIVFQCFKRTTSTPSSSSSTSLALQCFGNSKDQLIRSSSRDIGRRRHSFMFLYGMEPGMSSFCKEWNCSTAF